MPAVSLILAIVFAVLLAFMIFENNMLYRALWAIPIVLVFQAGFIMNKLEVLNRKKKKQK